MFGIGGKIADIPRISDFAAAAGAFVSRRLTEGIMTCLMDSRQGGEILTDYCAGALGNHDIPAPVAEDGRAGEPGVAERTDREQLTTVGGIRRIDIPAEPAQNRLVGRRLRCREFFDRQ